MKLEFGIILVVGIFVSISLGLIISNPDATPKSVSFAKYSDELYQINQLSNKYYVMEDMQKFEESKKQMQEILREIFYDYLELEISNVELIEGQYPFRDSSAWVEKFDLDPDSVCNFEKQIPLHMQLITQTENYERFAKKYSHYNLTLSILDERSYMSNVHYGLIAENDKNQSASTYFHIDSCNNERTDKELLFLSCFDENTHYRYATFNYDDIVSSYSNSHFCKAELDPWRQSVYEYGQKLTEERRAFEMEHMMNIENHEEQLEVFAEMNKQGDLGNIVWSIVHGKFDDQKTQDMIKQYEKQHGSLPDELLELIDKRK